MVLFKEGSFYLEDWLGPDLEFVAAGGWVVSIFPFLVVDIWWHWLMTCLVLGEVMEGASKIEDRPVWFRLYLGLLLLMTDLEGVLLG